MQNNFASSLKRVLVHEGGKVDDKRDPGGRTNQGVTQKTFNGFLTARGRKIRDVYTMTAAERDAIYKAQYWDAVKGDKLPDGVDFVLFDGAVNSGPAQSIKWLQRALGGVNVDGVLGQMTLAAVVDHPNHDALIDAICDRRLAFLKALKTWRTFGKGWTSRVEAVRKAGQAQASGMTPPKAVFFAGGNAKAIVEDAKRAPKTVVSDASAGGGFTLGSAIAAAQGQLQPIADSSPYIAQVVAGLAVASVVAVGAGGAWSWYARRRAAELKDALNTGVPKNDPAQEPV